MTLTIDLAEIRGRIAARNRRRVDRDLELRERGVVVLPDRKPEGVLISRPRVLARILPWRRRED